MRTRKIRKFTEEIFSGIYDAGHKWKYDIWALKFLALFFIIANFHWLNNHPILKLDSITITESIFFLYILISLLFRHNFSPGVQTSNLFLDFLFIALFDYLSLSLFGYGSRIYALYFIPVIYCGYWFKRGFTMIFTTLISVTYTLLNYYTPDVDSYYSPGEKIVKLVPMIIVFYLLGLGIIFYKRYFTDVDREREKHTEKLEQEKEYTRTLLKDKIDGFITIDDTGKIIDANPLAWELLGYTKEEILGQMVTNIYAPDEASKIMNGLRRSSDGTIDNVRTFMINKHNEEVPILLSAAFLYDRRLPLRKELNKGKKFPSLGYFRDIRAEVVVDSIASDIASITNEEEFLDKIVSLVAKTLKAEVCSVWFFDETGGPPKIVSTPGSPELPNADKNGGYYNENEELYVGQFPKYSEFESFKHFLGTPLNINGEFCGVIKVLNKCRDDKERDEEGFTGNDQLFLDRISSQVSILLEKIKNKQRFEVISKVGMEINEKVDVEPDELFRIIAENVVKGMGIKACTLRLIQETNKLKLKAYYGLEGDYLKGEEYTIEVPGGISGTVAKTGNKDIIKDLEWEERFKLKKLRDKEKLKSMLSIPLKYRNRVIGVINCYTGRKHKFTDQEAQIMETFAVYAAVAIQNKKRMDELMALNEIGGELLKPLPPKKRNTIEPERLLDFILQQAKEISGADSLCIKRYDEVKEEISTLRSLNCKWHDKNKDTKIELGKDIISETIKAGKIDIIENFDVERDTVGDVKDKELLKNIKSRILLPFKVSGKIYGQLCLESFRENYFKDSDVLSLKAFSIQTAIALRNDMFLNKLQMITDAFPKISELNVDVDMVQRKIVEIAAKILETDILILYLYDAKNQKIFWPPIWTGDPRFPGIMESEDISSYKPLSLIKGGKSHYAQESLEDGKMMSEEKPSTMGSQGRFVSREGIKSSAGIVLKVGQDVIGAMYINYRTPREFNADEQQLNEIFASYIAVALQNVMHFREKKLTDTLNAIGKVAANFAHKIRNDIGPIKIYAGDLLDDAVRGSSQYHSLKQIKDKISKITADVESLLKMTKVNVSAKERIDVNDLIRGLTSDISQDLEKNKITFQVEIETGLPKIEVDSLQVKMVFINLAQNSIDAVPEGGKISLTISRSNGFLLFVWEDTGCGISKLNSQKIFDALWSSKNKGYGLGLFFAKSIIEEHGGTITLDTNYKKGARFVILLPVKEPFDN